MADTIQLDKTTLTRIVEDLDQLADLLSRVGERWAANKARGLADHLTALLQEK